MPPKKTSNRKRTAPPTMPQVPQVEVWGQDEERDQDDGPSQPPQPVPTPTTALAVSAPQADIHATLSIILQSVQDVQSSHQDVLERVNTVARKVDAQLAIQGYTFKSPAAKVSAAYITQIQSALLEAHDMHSRSDLLKSIDSAMRKSSEFFKLVKRADSSNYGWNIAGHFNVNADTSSSFDDRWHDAERAQNFAFSQRQSRSATSSKPEYSISSPPSSQGFNPFNTQSNNPQFSSAQTSTSGQNQSLVQPLMQPQQSQQMVLVPAASLSQRTIPKTSGTVICYSCGEPNHYASSCPNRKNFVRQDTPRNQPNPSSM